MNTKMKCFMLLVLAMVVSAGLFAQASALKRSTTKPRMPGWVSEKGYWVVETNIHSPKTHIVRFYNNESELMYKETIAGVKMNPENRRVKMKLKKALETAAAIWSDDKSLVSDGNEADRSIVKTIFR